MSSMIEKLREDGMSAVFAIANGIFIPITLVYLIYMAVSFATMVPILQTSLGIEVSDLMALVEISDPIEQQRVATNIVEGVVENFGSTTVIWLLVLLVLILIIVSWFYNACFVASEQYVRHERTSLGDILKGSLNKNIFTLLLASILLFLLCLFFGFAAGVMSSLFDGGLLGGFIMLVVMILLGILLTRFVLTYPAIVHGGHSSGGAVGFSWSSVPFGKAAKYFLIGVVMVIIFGIVGLVVSLFQAMLMQIPTVGMVLYFLVSAIVSGYFSAWTTGALSALYYPQGNSGGVA